MTRRAAAAAEPLAARGTGPSQWTADLRLLPSAVAAWAAAAVASGGTAAASTAGGLGTATLALVLVVFVVLRRRSARRWFAGLAHGLVPVATIALILLATGGSLARAEAGPVSDAVDSGSPITVVLRVTGEPSALPPGAFGDGERFLVDADVVGGVLRGVGFTAATPVVVLGGAPWSQVGTGDIVRVLGLLQPSTRQGRATAMFLPSSRPTIEHATGWLGATDTLRTDFRTAAEQDGRDRGLLPGMVLGDRTALDPALEADMKITGLTHLTAVSGANCSYVLAFTFIGLRAARTPRAVAAAGAVMALAAFVLLVRPEPSVLRAAVMGSIGVAAVLSGRGRVSLTLLMLSIIILLAVDPWLSVSFAFMLSVAATLGLVSAGPSVVESMCRVMPRLPAQLLAIPLTAQLFCTPILVLLQPSLPVYSLPANVAASPVVPAVTLLGMVSVLALAGAPVLAQPLVASAQVGTRWVGAVADTFADLPGTSVPWATGPVGVVLAALASAAVLSLLVRRPASSTARFTARSRLLDGRPLQRVRGARDAGGGSPAAPVISHPGAAADSPVFPPRSRSQEEAAGVSHPHRRRSGRCRTAVAACVVLAVVGGFIVSHVRQPSAPSDWLLAACDVGQGDGLVVRTRPGHALVVDTGPDAAAMDRCLDRLGVDVVDALVITHLHDDHYGGTAGALRGRTVGALYYSTGEESLPREVADAASTAGVRPTELDGGTTMELDGVTVDVLWPEGPVSGGEENNASAVLDLLVDTPRRPVRILLTGDQEEDMAARMLGATPALRPGVDVLKIAHHGARNGGTVLIDGLDPRLAVISVGADNDYGHPHPTIVDALDAAGVPTARTDELGSFLIRIDGSRLEVRPIG
ncbi:hypothetical protein ASF21_11425 [Arthrobacter sp. Leaf234]|uniref:ComEC/Rec2 family competence protein n=1 Tax=Arthrobacter sp. Leaf234 TaxID=1736303 RepID=UPI0006FDAC2B|nr:ComEC/Rec2 family competence protein [Arthrobacter sp. Leaf234]KQO00903.1 hypothetical protein ASF21_11425 [Arthrobacter sp. Leaf234]